MIVFYNTLFLLLNLFQFSFQKPNSENKNTHIRYLQSSSKNYNSSEIPYEVSYEYNTCKVIHCGDDLCAAGPNAKCVPIMVGDVNLNLNIPGITEQKSYNYKCFCNEGFTTYKDDEIFLCCYEQKNGMTALLLEFFLGFGTGHFYLGNNFLGMLKALIYGVFCCSSCLILIKLFKSTENDGRSFIFKVTCTVCLLLCSCTYIGWQIVDSILFTIGGYSDSNGAPLYVS
jgi:hypothetical protein